ncbi:MAG: hypothetical protein Q9200_002016 [Gallowayella weberi]
MGIRWNLNDCELYSSRPEVHHFGRTLFWYWEALMAPIRESSYFPPLDKCLDGRHKLYSWKTTYIGLTELDFASADVSLERHLTDAQTIDLLKSSLLPSSPPTSQSKSMFETKTAAINVAPSPQGRYDIKQIQDDALWLSEKAAIDEVTALRIVILEWQTRSASWLQQSNLPDDLPVFHGSLNGTRVQPAFSASRSTYLFRPPSDGLIPAGQINGEETRRKQLVSIYLAELHYRLKTCSYLIGSAFSTSEDRSIMSSQPSGSIPRWVEEVGSDIIHSWDVSGVSQITGKNILIAGVDALRSRIRKLEEGWRWFPNHELNEPLEVVCCQSQILEMMAILDIMLVLLAILNRLPRADIVLSWFRLMTDYEFFEIFEPVSQITQNWAPETDPE